MTSVLIVGGGVIGMFCAARLAQRGVKVTLLEAEEDDFSGRGPAASLAAAGMLGAVSETAAAVEGVHPRLRELALESFLLWREQAPRALWGDGVRFDGAAMIARDGAHAEALGAHAKALGRKAVPIAPHKFSDFAGIDARPEHALFIEDEGVAEPERVLSGLAMEARRHGAMLEFGKDVRSISRSTARTVQGEVFGADVVLVTPGVWAHDQLLENVPTLKHLRPARGAIAPVRVEGKLKANVRGPGFYLARRGESDVVLGATMEFDSFRRAANEQEVAGLFAAAEKYFPGMVTPLPDHRPWAGVRPMSPDWAPLIGPNEKGVLVACGHSRNGWLLAPITAEIICAYVLGEDVPQLWAAFHPDSAERGAGA